MKSVVALVALLGFACFFILVTGTRVLVGETKVNPGMSYVVEDYGDLGTNGQSSLVCRYFNGRKILVSVFWYSSNNIMGRDSCPFFYDPRP